MPHALTGEYQPVMELKAPSHPPVDIFHGIMVPEFVGSSVGCVHPAPQEVKVFGHPPPVEMRIPYGREEIFPPGHNLPNGRIVPAHDFQHGVMQDNVMLVMPLGVLYVQDAPFKVCIFPGEQPCFVRADPAAVKEPEKDGDGHFPYDRLFPVVDDGDMVALMEETAELFLCKGMGDVSPHFLTGICGGCTGDRPRPFRKRTKLSTT